MGVTQGPKYMLQKVVPKWRLWNLSDPAKYGKGPIGALKNAYGEVSVINILVFHNQLISTLHGPFFGRFLTVQQLFSKCPDLSTTSYAMLNFESDIENLQGIFKV